MRLSPALRGARIAFAIAAVAGAAPLFAEREQDRSPVSGRERVAWNQSGLANELRFRIYVDATGFDATGVDCVMVEKWEPAFECSATLPPMSAGPHELRVAAVRAVAESNRSHPLFVVRSSNQQSTRTALLPDAIVVGGALTDPTDVAGIDDDLVFVGERDGRVLAIDPGRPGSFEAARLPLVQTGAGRGLLSIASSSPHDGPQFLFALHSTSSGARVVRFTRAGHDLYNLVTLLDLPLSPSHPRGVIRVGPDARVYVALDDGGDASAAGDLGSYSAKVLRFNFDGTAADDAPRASIIFSAGVNHPSAMTWTGNGRRLWLAGSDAHGRQLIAVSEMHPGAQSQQQTFAVFASSDVVALIGDEQIDESVRVTGADGASQTFTRESETKMTSREDAGLTARTIRALDRNGDSLLVLTPEQLLRIPRRPR